MSSTSTIGKKILLVTGLVVGYFALQFTACQLPELFLRPRYDFLYISANYHPNTGWSYSVRDGRLVRERLPSYPGDGPKDYEVPLYVHDVKKNESRVVSFEEARSFRLNTADKSPDGFWIGKESGTRHSRMSILLGRGRSGRKMNVVLEGEYPNYFSFQSLGWIEEPIRP